MFSINYKSSFGLSSHGEHDFSYPRCEVSQQDFPLQDRCYQKVPGNDRIEDRPYCKHCQIWMSPPDAASLVVATWFECKWFQYARRLKDEQLPAQSSEATNK